MIAGLGRPWLTLVRRYWFVIGIPAIAGVVTLASLVVVPLDRAPSPGRSTEAARPAPPPPVTVTAATAVAPVEPAPPSQPLAPVASITVAATLAVPTPSLVAPAIAAPPEPRVQSPVAVTAAPASRALQSSPLASPSPPPAQVVSSPPPSASSLPSQSVASSGTAESGFLNINSLPASLIVLDGKPIGSTPKVHLPVTAGAHTVVFTNSDLGVMKEIAVTVGAGETKLASARLRDGN